MRIFGTDDILPYAKTVVALGEFDGLHIAHMELINKAFSYAKEKGLPFGVMLFSKKLENKGKKLIDDTLRKHLLSFCDFLYIQDFDAQFREMTPFDFGRFLCDRLRVKTVFAGFNYRFGKGASGNSETLKALGMFEVHIIDEYKLLGLSVSSSSIRNSLDSGDVYTAHRLLGRPYIIQGTVVHGKKNGRKMGFPTVNIDYCVDMALPAFGVYVGYTIIDDKKYQSIINVGNNPTLRAKKITIESYLFDYCGDAYGKLVQAAFLSRIRDEMKFLDLDALSAQIEKDKNTAIKFFKEYTEDIKCIW